LKSFFDLKNRRPKNGFGAATDGFLERSIREVFCLEDRSEVLIF
jgi:hypothetical protein